jgi:hypothetical protein
LAERFNVANIRHQTALNSLMVTAEVFLKLIPLLAEKGNHTLGYAREAAQHRRWWGLHRFNAIRTYAKGPFYFTL